MKTWLILLGVAISGALLGLPIWTAALKGGESFSPENLVSLAVAILTLGATVFIAIFIYALQKKDTKTAATKQEIGAKKILYTELSTGLEAVIHEPWAGGIGDMSGQLSQLLIAYLPYIQESFEPEQLHHLIQLVDVMASTAKRAADEDSAAAAEYIQSWLGLFVEDRFLPAMRSQYADQFIRLDDYHRVLTPLTRSILEILSGESLPSTAGNRLTALDGTLLLEAAPNGFTKIYDEASELLCNALLDTDALGGCGIEEGWAKTDRYVGEFKNGRRHGQGCSYSLREHHKMFDGIWEDDKPKTGIQFDMVFEKESDDDKYEYLFPYWDESYSMSHHVIKYLTRRDDLAPEQVLARLYIVESVWVDNESSFIKSELRYPLADFMKKHDPERFLQVQELSSLFSDDTEKDGND